MMGSVDDRDAVIWLHRRAGFGLAAADVDAAVARGPAASLDDLLRPAPPADPWDDAQLPPACLDWIGADVTAVLDKRYDEVKLLAS